MYIATWGSLPILVCSLSNGNKHQERSPATSFSRGPRAFNLELHQFQWLQGAGSGTTHKNCNANEELGPPKR